jgi:hypothetical protein
MIVGSTLPGSNGQEQGPRSHPWRPMGRASLTGWFVVSAE